MMQHSIDNGEKLVQVIYDITTATDEVRLYLRYGDYLAEHFSDVKQKVNALVEAALGAEKDENWLPLIECRWHTVQTS